METHSIVSEVWGRQEWLQHPNLTARFFYVFSRFEYALKKAGYLQKKSDAMPDWNGFAADLPSALFAALKSDQPSKILFIDPPRKQVRWQDANGVRLTWEARPKEPEDMQELLAKVRCIRNNLFHGGKSLVGDMSEDGRNQRLLEAGLYVLRKTLQSSRDLGPRANGVYVAFEDDA